MRGLLGLGGQLLSKAGYSDRSDDMTDMGVENECELWVKVVACTWLFLEPNRAEQLVEEMWGDRSPNRFSSSLRPFVLCLIGIGIGHRS